SEDWYSRSSSASLARVLAKDLRRSLRGPVGRHEGALARCAARVDAHPHGLHAGIAVAASRKAEIGCPGEVAPGKPRPVDCQSLRQERDHLDSGNRGTGWGSGTGGYGERLHSRSTRIAAGETGIRRL